MDVSVTVTQRSIQRHVGPQPTQTVGNPGGDIGVLNEFRTKIRGVG